jgi:hypothetical protein
MSVKLNAGFYGLACLAYIFAFAAQAAPLSPADRNTVEQQQQNILQQNQRQRDELERSAEQPRFTPPVPASPASGPCFTISRITLDGATLLNEPGQPVNGSLDKSVSGYATPERADSHRIRLVYQPGIYHQPGIFNRAGLIRRGITHCGNGRPAAAY